MKDYISQELKSTIEVLNLITQDEELLATLTKVTQVAVDALRKGNKILFSGNGGSAADAQHLAAELVSRFSFDRPGLAAVALTTDTSAITAIGNDYGYEKLFARQVEAIGREGDVLFGITTSGKSPNILNGLKKAKEMNLITISLTGKMIDQLLPHCDYVISAPSGCTPKIQEAHIAMGHIICGLIEKEMFANKENH